MSNRPIVYSSINDVDEMFGDASKLLNTDRFGLTNLCIVRIIPLISTIDLSIQNDKNETICAKVFDIQILIKIIQYMQKSRYQYSVY